MWLPAVSGVCALFCAPVQELEKLILKLYRKAGVTPDPKFVAGAAFASGDRVKLIFLL